MSRAEDGRKLRHIIGAVIYTRVSTKGQTENLSLPTQLKTCEEYCERQGLEVIARFREEGESAKTADRTELQKLLTFCRANKGRVQFVVVYNLTRSSICRNIQSRHLARDCFDRGHRQHFH